MRKYFSVFTTFITGAGVQYFLDFIGVIRAFLMKGP